MILKLPPEISVVLAAEYERENAHLRDRERERFAEN